MSAATVNADAADIAEWVGRMRSLGWPRLAVRIDGARFHVWAERPAMYVAESDRQGLPRGMWVSDGGGLRILTGEHRTAVAALREAVDIAGLRPLDLASLDESTGVLA